MMIAVNSGEEELGQWVTIERDIVADYREAFGDNPPPLVGVAIMSDADNTGERQRPGMAISVWAGADVWLQWQAFHPA